MQTLKQKDRQIQHKYRKNKIRKYWYSMRWKYNKTVYEFFDILASNYALTCCPPIFVSICRNFSYDVFEPVYRNKKWEYGFARDLKATTNVTSIV